MLLTSNEKWNRSYWAWQGLSWWVIYLVLWTYSLWTKGPAPFARNETSGLGRKYWVPTALKLPLDPAPPPPVHYTITSALTHKCDFQWKVGSRGPQTKRETLSNMKATLNDRLREDMFCRPPPEWVLHMVTDQREWVLHWPASVPCGEVQWLGSSFIPSLSTQDHAEMRSCTQKRMSLFFFGLPAPWRGQPFNFPPK